MRFYKTCTTVLVHLKDKVLLFNVFLIANFAHRLKLLVPN